MSLPAERHELFERLDLAVAAYHDDNRIIGRARDRHEVFDSNRPLAARDGLGRIGLCSRVVPNVETGIGTPGEQLRTLMTTTDCLGCHALAGFRTQAGVRHEVSEVIVPLSMVV